MTQRSARQPDARVLDILTLRILTLRSVARCAALLAALTVMITVASDTVARGAEAAEQIYRLPETLPETLPDALPEAPCVDCGEPWTFQVAPDGLIYQTYAAGVKEPRFGAVLNSEKDHGSILDLAIGGRVGVLRYGTTDGVFANGWQLDVEGAAFPRLDPNENMDLEATDYRFGIPLTYGCGRYRMKIAYFHLSSHLGDEFAIRNGLAGRINYSRDSIVWGHSYWLSEALRIYGEIEYAFISDISQPWHMQFGVDYSTLLPTGPRGAPFAAINASLREEVNFGGNLVVQAGWQWTGHHDGQRIRLGLQYYNGQHEKYQFFRTSEEKIGLGIWYDF